MGLVRLGTDIVKANHTAQYATEGDMTSYRSIASRTLPVVLLLCTLLLAACGGGRAAPAAPVAVTAAPAATAAKPAAPTAAPTVAPAVATAIPAPAAPAGWKEFSTEGISLWLPGEWKTVEYDAADLAKSYEELQKSNPELAGAIGSADALQGVALWVFAPTVPGSVFTDNVNVRRTPLGGEKPGAMKEVVDYIVDQYKQMNFEVGETNADLKIGGRPAAYVAYAVPFTGADGKTAKMSGHQVIVLTDTDMWVVTYSFGPDSAAEKAGVLKQSRDLITLG